MTPETNKNELKRLRDIILATIEYSLEELGNTMKVDGQIPLESHYRKIK